MSNLIQAARDELARLLREACLSAAEAGELPAGVPLAGSLEIPKDTKNGDYASGAAMSAAKEMRLPPRVIGERLLGHLRLEGSFFSSAELAAPGFLNFRLSDRWYGAVLAAVEDMGGRYGESDAGGHRRVMVEFVSANPTGTMTIGNARGGVLGDALCAVLSRVGYDVWREFYVNDAGNQIELFARSLEARYLQLISGEDAVPFPEDGYHGEDIRDLARLFYEQHGDAYADEEPETRRAALRAFGLERNIAKMRADLERYGIFYDEWFLESSLHESGYIEDTVRLLSEGGYTYEKDGALWLRNTALGADKDEVLRRANGFYTYYAADMAYHRNKFLVRGFDKVIDVWGADHHGHAIRFRASMPALGVAPERLDFLIMQLVRLVRDGETVKVSKRSGRVITLADLLDEIPADSVRFSFSAKPGVHLDFDMDLAVRQDAENPVYYVQYAHARICSLIARLAEEGFCPPRAADVDTALLSGPHERALIKTVAQYPEELLLAARDYDPSRVNRYLTALAGDFHRFYNHCHILGEEPSLLSARLKLADAVRAVLCNGLSLLGVTAPEKM